MQVQVCNLNRKIYETINYSEALQSFVNYKEQVANLLLLNYSTKNDRNRIEYSNLKHPEKGVLIRIKFPFMSLD